jgi:aspartate oxidase
VNRLASISLLEGLVWEWRAGEDAVRSQAAVVLPSKVGAPQLGMALEENLSVRPT